MIGKHSGKHAIESILKELGYGLNNQEIDNIVEKIKQLADNQKSITQQDIFNIVQEFKPS